MQTDSNTSNLKNIDLAACERMWVAGRALILRRDGLSSVEASMQATWESQEFQRIENGN